MVSPTHPDAMLLAVLDDLDRGLTGGQVAERHGLPSRSAALGIAQRIRRETDLSDPDRRGDGSMPAGWWKKGLEVKGRAPW